MRRAEAGGATLSAAALALVAAALFLGAGISDQRLFWIGGAALLLAAAAAAAALLGLRPAPILGRAGIAFFVLLGVLVAWQGASMAWSITASRSWDSTNRGLVYLAFAAVGALLGGSPRRLAEAAAALLGALFVVALSAKVVPAFYPDYGRLARLRFPLDYWNELALLGVAAAPLALWLSGRVERRRRVRVAGVLLLYAALVVVVLTFSRVGVVLALLAALLWLLLDRERLEGLEALALAVPAAALAAGSGLLLPGVASDEQGHAVRLDDGLLFGAVLLAVALALAVSARVVFRMRFEPARRRQVARAAALVLVLLVLAALGAAVVRAGGPAGFVRARWHEFDNSTTRQLTESSSRLTSASSSNRWQWWQEAWRGFTNHPLEGTGAGSFELADRHLRHTSLVTIEPHNTPLQFLSETGIVGFGLYAAAALAAVLGLRRRERDPARTALTLAALLALVHSIVDIDWQFVAVQGPLFLLVGALIARPGERGPRRPLFAAAIAVCGLAALYSLASPWLANRQVDGAYAALARGDFAAVVSDAKQAHSLNPLDVQPILLQASIESALGHTQEATGLFVEATRREPRNPDAWYQLGDFVLAKLGNPRLAYVYLNHSYTLDSRGPAGIRCADLDTARWEAFREGPGGPSCRR